MKKVHGTRASEVKMEKEMTNVIGRSNAFEHSRAVRANWLLNRTRKFESLAALSSSFQKEQDDKVVTQDTAGSRDNKGDGDQQDPVVEEPPQEDAVVPYDDHEQGPVTRIVHSRAELESNADSTGECVEVPSYQEETKLSTMKEDEMEIKIEVVDQSPKHENAANEEDPSEEDDEGGSGDDNDIYIAQYVGQIGDSSGHVGGAFDFDELHETVFSNGTMKEEKCDPDFKFVDDTSNPDPKPVQGKSSFFTCEKRDFSTSSRKSLTRHHEGIKDYKCDMCGYTAADQKSVLCHEKSVHDKIKDCICDECGRAFSDSQRKRTHVRTVHDKVKEHGCDLCEYVASGREHLDRHKLSVHQAAAAVENQLHQIEDVIEGEMSCLDKGDDVIEYEKADSVKVEPDLKHIVGADHDQDTELIVEEVDKMANKELQVTKVDPKQEDASGIFQCVCGQTYSHQCSLDRHVKRDHGRQRFSCQHCDRVFTNNYHLRKHTVKEHMDVETGATFAKGTCSMCNMSFSRKGDFKEHLESVHQHLDATQIIDPEMKFGNCEPARPKHKTKKPTWQPKMKRKRREQKTECEEDFVCDECGKTFKGKHSKVHLLRHKEQIHLNIRNFQCERCPHAFYYKAGLDEHVKRVHLKLKDTGTSFRSFHIRIVFHCQLLTCIRYD